MTAPVLTHADLDRFRSRVELGANKDCWRWLGAFFSTGYPAFWVRHNNMGGHRIMCLLYHGPAVGRMALHSCDNPACVNPNHLRWGTGADNMHDRTLRGRAPHGETHSIAKLNVGAVRDIRARALAGENHSSIGRSYGVTSQCVTNAVRRLTWRHVA